MKMKLLWEGTGTAKPPRNFPQRLPTFLPNLDLNLLFTFSLSLAPFLSPISLPSLISRLS